jgi:methyl-accepting chemotaxis protein
MERTMQEAFLKKMANTYPFIELLYITNEQGRQITSNISATDGFATSYGNDGFQMDWSKRPWFIGAKKSDVSFVTDLYRSAATGTFCYTVSCILKDDHQRIKGVLGADINFQQVCNYDKSASTFVQSLNVHNNSSSRVFSTIQVAS